MNKGSRKVLMNEWLNDWMNKAVCTMLPFLVYIKHVTTAYHVNARLELPIMCWISRYLFYREKDEQNANDDRTYSFYYILHLRHFQLIEYWKDLIGVYLRHHMRMTLWKVEMLLFKTYFILWNNSHDMNGVISLIGKKMWVGEPDSEIRNGSNHHHS